MAHVLKASGHASNRKYSVASSITTLLRGCRPTTISGLIIAILVGESVNAKPWGAFTHVLQECAEVIPSVAHGYSPSTVIFERWKFEISASLNHSSPSIVGARIREAVGTSVWHVPAKATAGFCVTGFKVQIGLANGVAAITQTKGPRFAVYGGEIFDNQKPSKPLALEQQSIPRHNGICVVFSGGSRQARRGSLRLCPSRKGLQVR